MASVVPTGMCFSFSPIFVSLLVWMNHSCVISLAFSYPVWCERPFRLQSSVFTMANSWGSIQLEPTLMGTAVMDRAEQHISPSSALPLHNQTHFLLQLWITNSHMHINSLLFGVEKVQVDMNVCGVLCVMWLFSAITLFNERKMEALRKWQQHFWKAQWVTLCSPKVCVRAP